MYLIYKEKVLNELTIQILSLEVKRDKLRKSIFQEGSLPIEDNVLYSSYTKEIDRLRRIREIVKLMETRLFTPKRFPDSKFLSIKLSIPKIINNVYNK